MQDLQEIFEVAARKRLRLSKSDYYRRHLMIINGILPEDSQMTPDQINVLAAFMCLDGDIKRHRFGSTGRKIVMEQLGLKPSALSNQLAKLKDKGALTEGERKTEYNIRPLLLPNENEQYYIFKLENEGVDHDKNTEIRQKEILVKPEAEENSSS